MQQGLDLIRAGRYEEALEAEDRALALAPKDPNAHSYRGSALLQLGRTEEALSAYERVLVLAPQAAVAHYNRANALRRLGRHPDALASLKLALAIKPAYPDALTAAGIVLQALGDTAGALSHYERAIALDPAAADAHYNKALALLADGRLAEGWQEYEWRLHWEVTIRSGQSRAVERIAPDWDGSPLAGPLLVLPEQGLGDQIFYGGMLGDLQQAVPGSTVCVEPRLVSLLARSFSTLQFTSPGRLNAAACRASGQYAAQIAIGSLGRVFRSSAASLSRVRSPYLLADPQRSAALRQRLYRPGRLVCGLSWVSKNLEFGRDKSLTLDTLLPLLSQPGIDCIDLQYGDTLAERQALAADHGLQLRKLDDIDNLNDIDGLAALISACDIVVTVSNTTAHLAAALGKPVIVMLPDSPSLFWHWHRSRHDSPWYPSATLLRQAQAGDWSEVISIACGAVDAFRQGLCQ